MSFADTYNGKLNEATDRFQSLFAGNKEKLFRTATNVILTIVVLAIFGCFDFVNMEWDWTRIFTYAFWTKVTSKTVAAVCCFNIGINFNWEGAIATFYVLKKAISDYEALIKDKDDEHFDYYVNQVYNMESKKKAWINKINRKIYRLDRFGRNRDKLLYTSKIPEGVADYERKREELERKKAHNRYCVKRRELEELKSEQYINDNIGSLSVRYSKVNPSAFEMDINGKIVDEDNKVTGSVALGKARATAGVVWGSVLITAVMSAIIISVNQQQFVDQMQAFWYYLLSAAVDVGIVVWNLFRGTTACKPIIEEQIHRPYVNRNKILKAFIAWKIKNDVKPSESFKRIQELTNPPKEEFAEISKEDYEKLKQGGESNVSVL